MMYWILVFYILPIVFYYFLGVSGVLTLQGKQYNWDYLIFIPIYNLYGLGIILYTLFNWKD